MKENNRSLIIEQYKDKKRLINKREINSLLGTKKNFSGPIFKKIKVESSNSFCGDEITFLILEENKKKIKKIWFSNENCCIITGAAANIAANYLENIKNEKDFQEFKEIIENLKVTILGEECSNIKNFESYHNIGNFNIFSNLKDFKDRKECISIIVDFIERIYENEL